MREVQALSVVEADYKWPDDELVVRKSDYDALAAECERLRNASCECGAPVGYVSGEKFAAEHERLRECRKERDAALAELAALKGGQVAVAWISWTNDDPEWKLKMLAEPVHPPVVPLKLYLAPPSPVLAGNEQASIVD